MHPVIAVRELTKRYEEGASGTLALRGVDLDVHAGELLMLMGPSGSGKTTLPVDHGLHPDGEFGKRAGRRGSSWAREKAVARAPPGAYRIRLSGVQSVPHANGR